MVPLLTKNKLAGGTIYDKRFVKAGSDYEHVIQATSGLSPILGVAKVPTSAASGARLDIVQVGEVDVECGGSISFGAQVTADANGKAVAASLVPATLIYTGGIAMQDGVSGDIIPILFLPSVLANSDVVAMADVTISTAELLALFTTAKEIIPAPGANKTIQVLHAEAFLDYNSAAYDGVASGEDLILAYTNVSGTALARFETTGFLDQASDQVRVAAPLTPVAATNLTPTVNAAVVAAIEAANIATGDSPVKMRVWYRILDTAW